MVAEDKESVLAYFENIPEETKENLQIFVTDNFSEELAEFEEARAVKVDARLIITITIFAISLLLLYFSMKSNAMKKIEDIMVYPWGAALGIIVFLFVINTITGILPIIGLVRKPPAQLTN